MLHDYVTQQKQKSLQSDKMILADVQKFSDEWPQVSKIVHVSDAVVREQWFKGSKSGQWNPCTVPFPGKEAKGCHG